MIEPGDAIEDSEPLTFAGGRRGRAKRWHVRSQRARRWRFVQYVAVIDGAVGALLVRATEPTRSDDDRRAIAAVDHGGDRDRIRDIRQ